MTRASSRLFRAAPFRPLIWGFHLALPLIGLWLLLGNPGLDAEWRDPVAHFWLVLGTALLGVGLAILVAASAQRQADARLYLVALGFTTAAGFLGLHALVTPTVVVHEPSAAFNLATPIGVAASAVFALVAALDLTPTRAARVLTWKWFLAGAVALALAAWTALELLPGSPLHAALPPAETGQLITIVAIVGVALFGIAVVRSIQRLRVRSSVVGLSVVTAQILLAESLVAMALAPNWHASWWLWHVLMAIAFAYIVYASQVQYRREGRATTLFSAIAVEETLARMRADHAAALAALVEAIESDGSGSGGATTDEAIQRLQARFDLTDGQAEVLEQAADALAEERLDRRRLAALVAVGRESRVATDEAIILDTAVERLRAVFPTDGLVILRRDDERLTAEAPRDAVVAGGFEPDATSLELARAALTAGATMAAEGADAHLLSIPLVYAEQRYGVLLAWRSQDRFSQRAQGILESAANQLAVVLENARLYRQVERLFRAYLSPDVVRTLLADPARSGLGGAITEATVLFADLRGFSAFAVGTDPADVVALLNRYFGAVVPLILAEGGTVIQFVGDALMAVFNAPVAQADHPLRAARAAIALQQRVGELAADQPDWPRFRVGIETGPVLVGNLGASEVRTFTAIGETTNLAARLQAYAQVGHIVVGPAAAAALGDVAELRQLGDVELKGFPDPIPSFELVRLREPTPGA